MSATNFERVVAAGSAEREVAFSSRASRNSRFERDGIIFTANGRVGTLRQVIVDCQMGEVRWLVVEMDRGGEWILVPPTGVERTRGSAVFLATTRDQFEEWARTATRYEPSKVVRANLKQLVKSGSESIRNVRLAVSQARADFVETGPR